MGEKSGQISPLGIWPNQMFPQPLPWLASLSPVRFSHWPGPHLQGLPCPGFCLRWRETKDPILILISSRFGIPGCPVPSSRNPQTFSDQAQPCVVSALRTGSRQMKTSITLRPLSCRGNHSRALYTDHGGVVGVRCERDDGFQPSSHLVLRVSTPWGRTYNLGSYEF